MEPRVGEPRVGRASAIGAAVGFAVSVIAVAIAGTAAGMGFGASCALGVFVGVWGGLGFGFMGAASVCLSNYHERATHEVVVATEPDAPQQQTVLASVDA